MKYFKHDLNTREDDKIWELIDRQGLVGYGAWWVILEELYKAEDNGFTVQASETWLKRLGKALNLSDYRTLIRLLDTMAELNLIDSQMWAEHILFAPGVLRHGDSYVQQKAKNRDRVRKYREKQASLDACNDTAISCNALQTQMSNALQTRCNTNTDPDPDSDPNTDPDPNINLEEASEKKLEYEQKRNTSQPLEPFGRGRRFNSIKGTHCSCATDAWMESESNPVAAFKNWVVEKRKRENSKVNSPADVASEIRNNYMRASDLWQEYQESLQQQQQDLGRLEQYALSAAEIDALRNLQNRRN